MAPGGAFTRRAPVARCARSFTPRTTGDLCSGAAVRRSDTGRAFRPASHQPSVRTTVPASSVRPAERGLMLHDDLRRALADDLRWDRIGFGQEPLEPVRSLSSPRLDLNWYRRHEAGPMELCMRWTAMSSTLHALAARSAGCLGALARRQLASRISTPTPCTCSWPRGASGARARHGGVGACTRQNASLAAACV